MRKIFAECTGDARPVISFGGNESEFPAVSGRNCECVRNLVYQRVDGMVDRELHGCADFFGKISRNFIDARRHSAEVSAKREAA